MAFDAKWSGNVKRKLIGNIMVILGLGILIFSLLNPFENMNKVFNVTVNLGLWFLVLGILIKRIRRKKKEKD
jgi:formate-dependent nitrite reductase membrane component NrfD